MSSLDTQSQNLAQWSLIDATATGTNAITLAPNLSGFTAPAYLNYITYRFTAANSVSGLVTLRISALAFLNVYGADNTTQMTTGNIVSGRAYYVSYNSALNSGAGGWTLTPLGTSTGGVSNPVLVAEGGTSNVSAAAARGSAGLNIDQAASTSFNADSAIAAATRTVISSTTAMTGGHILTLPAANAVNAGQALDVLDLNGVTGAQTLTIQRAGADTINGTTSVALATQYGGWRFKSDGASKWTAQYMPPSSVSGVTAGNAGISVTGSAVSFNTNNVAGIGTFDYCVAQSGSIAQGATGSVASVGLDILFIACPTSNSAGTWRNLSGNSMTVDKAAMAIRTA